MKHEKIKVVTGTVRFNQIRLDPRSPLLINGEPFKYSLQIVINKSQVEEAQRINKAVEHLKKGQPLDALGGLTEGSEPNTLILNLSSKEMPALIDSDLNPILDISEIHDGCIGRVSITCFTYKANNSVDVGFELNSIMKQSNL